MQVRFIGSGDAFGTDGRMNSSFLLSGVRTAILIDCGATVPVGLNAARIDQNAIATILLTHFHLDHAGGVPGFILNAQFNTKRTAPLTIAGPPPLRTAVERLMEAAFPGSSGTRQRFPLTYLELEERRETVIDGAVITPFRAEHGAPVGRCLSYRIEAEGKVIACTGDTEWVENLVPLGRDADLLIAEAYTFAKKVPFHLDLVTLEGNLPRIAPKRLILTHPGADLLANRDQLRHQLAADGLVIDL